MTWEWDYDSKLRHWTLTLGEWRAIVERVEGPRYLWQAYVERVVAPHDRYDGPRNKDAMVARTCCLRKIAELRANSTP